MGLRRKITGGFAILALFLILAVLYSVYQLRVIGTSGHKMLNENYGSLNAAADMLEALERQDSAVLLLLLGKSEEGATLLASADQQFQAAMSDARRNITVNGENAAVEAVDSSYNQFRRLWKSSVWEGQDQRTLAWYTSQLHPAFVAVKAGIFELMDLNEITMYEAAADLQNKADRAVMPAIVAVLAALLFTLLFSYFVNHYMVGPIIRMTRAAEDFLSSGKPFEVTVESRDEVAHLQSAIQSLCSAAKTNGERS